MTLVDLTWIAVGFCLGIGLTAALLPLFRPKQDGDVDYCKRQIDGLVTALDKATKLQERLLERVAILEHAVQFQRSKIPR
jgi:hypothetical protein